MGRPTRCPQTRNLRTVLTLTSRMVSGSPQIGDRGIHSGWWLGSNEDDSIATAALSALAAMAGDREGARAVVAAGCGPLARRELASVSLASVSMFFFSPLYAAISLVLGLFMYPKCILFFWRDCFFSDVSTFSMSAFWGSGILRAWPAPTRTSALLRGASLPPC